VKSSSRSWQAQDANRPRLIVVVRCITNPLVVAITLRHLRRVRDLRRDRP
jgi:hypothetical protein